MSRHIADDLMERIADGEFGVGDRLPIETELMSEYAVGRNAAREAVQGLVALGMVDVRPRRGAVILAATPERVLPMGTLSSLLDTPIVHDLYDVRLLLECRAAELAAERRDPDEVRAIEGAAEAFAAAVERDDAVWQADIAFHESVSDASGNAILPRILEAAHGLLASARRATADVPVAVRNAVYEHRLIAEAIANGDPDAAAAAMRLHITHGREAYDLATGVPGASEPLAR